jgi:hypothetical protein
MKTFKSFCIESSILKDKIRRRSAGLKPLLRKPKSVARFQTKGYTPKFPLEQGVGNY